MQNKKRVLITSSTQFGYLTDTLKYCEYLNKKFSITYVCWDYQKSKIEIEGIEVIYISRQGSLVERNFRLLKAIHRQIKKNYDIVFSTYIRGISIIKLLSSTPKFNLDIRTLSVNRSWAKRITYNLFLKLESYAFKNISVVSDGVAKKLSIKNYTLLPLGGECYKETDTQSEKLIFIYVGTLQGRNFLTFIKAFHKFSKQNNSYKVHLRIIGDSPGNELSEIQNYTIQNKITNIELLGRINQDKLHPYFEDASIGVSYIPLTSWYEHQPPTKTYEYLVSGLPVIATNTFENNKVINPSNGVIIEDHESSIINGLSEVYLKFESHHFNQMMIKESSVSFLWKEVINKNLIKIFEH
ncbi:glycosyltransferase [Solitalea sp. MAHUQ-68]|uniref:Glycosyltransferase n=1 Tax=Solitalea agri TaxID=2953739 RepID=A0A9X2JE82_9SPHI|nr:glycosyltransferase [Solitalea agri]MCO4293680.1 glycosyltransferase [Solitalea agri]